MLRELGEHIFSVGVMNDIPLFAAQEDFPSGGFFYVQEKGSRRSLIVWESSKGFIVLNAGIWGAICFLVPGGTSQRKY